MPNPKRRHSKTRTAKRRTHDALEPVPVGDLSAVPRGESAAPGLRALRLLQGPPGPAGRRSLGSPGLRVPVEFQFELSEHDPVGRSSATVRRGTRQRCEPGNWKLDTPTVATRLLTIDAHRHRRDGRRRRAAEHRRRRARRRASSADRTAARRRSRLTSNANWRAIPRGVVARRRASSTRPDRSAWKSRRPRRCGRKPRASIRLAAEAVRDGQADALFSAGHTGASVMAAHRRVRPAARRRSSGAGDDHPYPQAARPSCSIPARRWSAGRSISSSLR